MGSEVQFWIKTLLIYFFKQWGASINIFPDLPFIVHTKPAIETKHVIKNKNEENFGKLKHPWNLWKCIHLTSLILIQDYIQNMFKPLIHCWWKSKMNQNMFHRLNLYFYGWFCLWLLFICFFFNFTQLGEFLHLILKMIWPSSNSLCWMICPLRGC